MRIMSPISVRFAEPFDIPALARMRADLWPESSVEEHAQELAAILAGTFPTVMPLVILVATESNQQESISLVGFIEVGLRSYAEGCDSTRAVGYVEGWYVSESHRRSGIGTKLFHAAEDWARRQGCKEIASDSELTNEISQRVHEALGFEIVERSINYRKQL
jgi:aminoglycoside 6'-N-acetyltransferase I